MYDPLATLRFLVSEDQVDSYLTKSPLIQGDQWKEREALEWLPIIYERFYLPFIEALRMDYADIDDRRLLLVDTISNLAYFHDHFMAGINHNAKINVKTNSNLAEEVEVVLEQIMGEINAFIDSSDLALRATSFDVAMVKAIDVVGYAKKHGFNQFMSDAAISEMKKLSYKFDSLRELATYLICRICRNEFNVDSEEELQRELSPMLTYCILPGCVINPENYKTDEAVNAFTPQNVVLRLVKPIRLWLDKNDDMFKFTGREVNQG